MKLTNPTDEELNAAFATEVCGLKVTNGEYFTDHMRMGRVILGDSGPGIKSKDGYDCESFLRVQEYTKSADLVLPWLEKREEAGFHYLKGQWYVHLYAEDKSCANSQGLALAATIALLRANGVEVEFK